MFPLSVSSSEDDVFGEEECMEKESIKSHQGSGTIEQ